MTNLKDDKITSYFTYDELFCTCKKKLYKESTKLKHVVSTSKKIISSTWIVNKNLLTEIESLKGKQIILISYSSSHEDLVKPLKCEQWSI